MEKNKSEQLTKDLTSCESDTLAIFSQFCRDKVREEMVALLTLPECTTGAEICKTVVVELSTRQIDISEILSVTTDGDPSMTGKKAGFVNLFEKDADHPLIGFHCIIHDEALCAKDSLKELQELMQTVAKIVIYISPRFLNKRQFLVVLNEVHSVYKGLKMYSNVRWLSRGLSLKRMIC